MLLREFADLLELTGESAFRLQAFRRAADQIGQYPTALTDLDANAWQLVPGVGKGIAATIGEIMRRGSFDDLDRLRATIPSTVIRFTALPGVGVRTAAKLHKILGVATLDELRNATGAGRVAASAGLGSKLEQQLRAGFAQLDRYQGRWSIGLAYPLAQILTDQLSARTGARVEIAGSTRRLAETVGDINLLASGACSNVLFEALRSLPPVVADVGHDLDSATVELDRGLRARLVITDPERFGSEWVRHTGSAAHVAALRDLGGADIFDRAFETEAAFYERLGIAVIPADLRVGRAEIESQRQGELAHLIGTGDVRGDLHAHTTWSDGKNDIQEMARGALALGYNYLSISDHSQSLGVANGLTPQRLRDQWLEIDRLNAELRPFRLLKSCEVEIKRNGDLDLPDDVLAELDMVVASLHSGLRDPSETVTARLLSAIRHPHVDIIAHPSGRLIGGRDGADYDWEAVYRAAADTGTALEINGSSERLDLTDERAREAAAHGVTLSLGSDAHGVEGLDAMKFGLAVARRAGLRASSLLNSRLPDRLRAR